MADTKISGLTALTGASALASGDLSEFVDVSDTTMASSGTNKKVTYSDLVSNIVNSTSGSTLQAWDADLDALAGLTFASNTMITLGASHTAQTETFQNWTNYTPTFANTTLGNGTRAGRYMQIGKLVCFVAAFSLGSTSAVSTAPTVSVPVTISGSMSTLGTSPNRQIGLCSLISAGTLYHGDIDIASTTTATIRVFNTVISSYSGTQNLALQRRNIASAIPNTWTTNDEIWCWGMYEAA